ncbi:hypothetical protein [Cryobacterium sp. PAMC25264]|nr:hypothetical protein [Cryobacterium sp. PAMC25264]QYF73745.1 hypothetical protein KY500_00135 [Cryobacterium sp. PAMC25264]
MGIRRRTRRIRRWYRRHEHSAGMLAARVILVTIAAVVVAALALYAIRTM